MLVATREAKNTQLYNIALYCVLEGGNIRYETFPAEVVFPFRGGKGDAATGTEGGADEADPGRAGRAEGEGAVTLHDDAAGEAAGRKDHVGNPGQDLSQGYIPRANAVREAVSSGTAIRGASAQSLSRS